MDTDHDDSILSASVYAHFKPSPLDFPPHQSYLVVFRNLFQDSYQELNMSFLMFYKSFNMKKLSKINPLCCVL